MRLKCKTRTHLVDEINGAVGKEFIALIFFSKRYAISQNFVAKFYAVKFLIFFGYAF